MTPVEQATLDFLRRDVPRLADEFMAQLPRARRTGLAGLTGALLREDALGLAGRARRSGTCLVIDLPEGTLAIEVEREFAFSRRRIGRVTLNGAEITHPVALLRLLNAPEEFTEEVAESAANLAMAYASVRLRPGPGLSRPGSAPRPPQPGSAPRPPQPGSAPRPPQPDPMMFERFCAEGHNIHPCGRVRRGMSPAESHRYAAECAGEAGLRLVAVPADLIDLTPDEYGRAPGDILAEHFPLPPAPVGHVVLPVHPWQLEHAIPDTYPEGVVTELPGTIRATSTTSMRSVVTEPGRHGRRLVVKTALDVLLTSTRRNMSPATTANGPKMSRFLAGLLDAEPAMKGRAAAVRELAGASFRSTDRRSARNLSAIIREDPADYLGDGEIGITACALGARTAEGEPSLLAGLMAQEPLDFLRSYAGQLLPVALTLLVKYGIGLESHLQNTIVVFSHGRPVRLLLRDFAGMRLQLARAGLPFEPHPDSITVVPDIETVREKAFYAAVQANLAEIIVLLATEFGVSEEACWAEVRRIADGVFAELAADPSLADRVAGDRAALYAPFLGQKAFVRMRLDPSAGDVYRPLPNPLSC